MRMGIICATVAGALAALAVAAPKAGPATTKWQLDFEFHDLQRLELKLPGESEPTTYWYLLYQVSNNTRRDVGFYPTFTIVTDTLDVVKGGENISPSVYDAIRKRHRGEYPFFAPPAQVTGHLLQGEDHARASAAVFRDFDARASGLSLYISGLAGEIVRVTNPALLGTSDGGGRSGPPSFILQRTLAIQYDLPGDPVTRLAAQPVRRGRQWVMR